MGLTKLGPYVLGPEGENLGVYQGDARILAEAIPDESVDLIFTDPVYQNVDDYQWLAEIAARVLKPGGSLIAQSGKMRLPTILPAMQESNLTWQTLLAEIYPVAFHRMMYSKTMEGWKPHIWFSKGTRTGGWVFDRFHGSGRRKRFHRWGDNPDFATIYISRITDMDAIILDPFTGGGTVPAVCKMLSRQYLAFEIEPNTVALARERIRLTQPPLPLVIPCQDTMSL